MSVCIALILSGGAGQRFGDVIPKQYLPLVDRAVIRHAVDAFLNHPNIDHVRIVRRPQDQIFYDNVFDDLKILEPVDAGETRQDSARLGLESLKDLDPDTVLIHDGARPFPTEELITRTLDALKVYPAAIPVLPVLDTIKEINTNKNLVNKTINREKLFRAQTPQGFNFKSILNAHRKNAKKELTDDAMIAEKDNLEIATVLGDKINLKITTPEDLKLARKFFMQRNGDSRVGTGYDVHTFEKGDHVMLCGVKIPYKRGLKGHSDADIGIHALTDAILGAIAEGDIGSHFPPTEKKWQNASSSIFLMHAASLVKKLDGRIINVDITIICEEPKIAPYQNQMRQQISKILTLPVSSTSIKATTTEKLGFLGRGEGIAAQAVATVFIPEKLD
tara:strand:+ start:398 stop:1567 length:1170 start_codon:yes stop_codon:yes gene_type:complete